jgi:ribosome maturation factor RimP
MDKLIMLEQIEELVSPALAQLGYELIEREYVQDGGHWVLRLFIDKSDGITVGDCAQASRGIQDLIEVEGLIPDNYRLEISSPGIERPIRRRVDFEKLSGSTVKLKTLNPVDGRSNYRGTLEGLDGDEIVMAVDGIRYRVPYKELARARVIPDEPIKCNGKKSVQKN